MAAEINPTEEKQFEFHKKKSQSTSNLSNKRKYKFNVQYLKSNYPLSPVSEAAPIVSSISHSIRSSTNILMDDATTTASRCYYQQIVNDDRASYDEKKLKIYLDLVVGSKSELKTDGKKLENNSEFCLKYKIGTNANIQSVKGCALTVGRYKEADICTGYSDLTISRIQCFILIIDDSLIILDGWSYFGTKTMQINDEKNNLLHSMPNKRYILRFNKTDTIHLRFGETNVDLIINPKPCIVCLDKSRIIRNECGHLVLCNDCYNNILSANSKSLCPVCRAPLNKINQKNNLKNNKLNKYNNNNDMILSYCKPSHLL